MSEKQQKASASDANRKGSGYQPNKENVPEILPSATKSNLTYVQRVVGNKRLQHLLENNSTADSPISVARKFQGLPPVRGVAQKSESQPVGHSDPELSHQAADILQRNGPNTKVPPQKLKGRLIATIVVKEGDTPKSIMTRALIEFGLPEDQASKVADQLTITTSNGLPKSGESIQVFLTDDVIRTLGKKIEDYEEGQPGDGKGQISGDKKDEGGDDPEGAAWA